MAKAQLRTVTRVRCRLWNGAEGQYTGGFFDAVICQPPKDRKGFVPRNHWARRCDDQRMITLWDNEIVRVCGRKGA